MEYFPGQMVYSKSGRDKGRPFLVISCEGAYLYLADGELRPVERPKKKKIIHVQKTGFACGGLGDKFINGETVTNSEISKALRNISAKK